MLKNFCFKTIKNMVMDKVADETDDVDLYDDIDLYTGNTVLSLYG